MKKLTLLCLLISTAQLHAAAATVLFTSNKVTGMHAGASRDITRGTTLDAGDSITTGPDAVANIKYTNGTLVNIGANSNYKILDYSPKQGDVQIKSELSSGSMNTKTDGKTKEKVKTPVIALAVLGTKFELAVLCDKQGSVKNREKCKKTANVHIIEGKVQVGNQILGPGASVEINSSGTIRPAPFPAAGQVNEPAGATGSTNTTSSSSSDVPATSYSSGVSLTTATTANSTTADGSTSSAPVITPPPSPLPPPTPPIGPLLPPGPLG